MHGLVFNFLYSYKCDEHIDLTGDIDSLGGKGGLHALADDAGDQRGFQSKNVKVNIDFVFHISSSSGGRV